MSQTVGDDLAMEMGSNPIVVPARGRAMSVKRRIPTIGKTTEAMTNATMPATTDLK